MPKRDFRRNTSGWLLLTIFCKNVSPATLLKKRLWHRCFPVNFAKFLRTPFLTEHLQWLLLKLRVLEHQGVWLKTGKYVKGTLSTSVRDHMLIRDHQIAWENIEILGAEFNKLSLDIQESLFIKKNKPTLNRTNSIRSVYDYSLLIFRFHLTSFLVRLFVLFSTFLVIIMVETWRCRHCPPKTSLHEKKDIFQ